MEAVAHPTCILFTLESSRIFLINLFPSDANGKEIQTLSKDIDYERFCVLVQLTQPLEKFHLSWVLALVLPHLVLQGAQSLLHYPCPLHPVQVQQLCQYINPGETVQVGTPSAATPALIPELFHAQDTTRADGASFLRSKRTSVQCLGSSAPCSASPGTAGAAGSSPSGTSPTREGQPLHSSPASPLPKKEDGGAVTSLGMPNPRTTACMPSLVPWCMVPCPEEGERGRRGTLVLTELVVRGWPAEQPPPDQELQVVEQDEGRGRRRAAVVLLDQVVPLELPDLVRVLLHLLEGVAGAEPRCQRCRGDEGTAHHV